MYINKNDNGNVKYTEEGVEHVLFPNLDEGSGSTGEGDAYQSGTVIKSGAGFTKCVYFPGLITGNKKNFQTSIFLPKSLKNITSVNITKLKGSIRVSSGGYVGTPPVDFLGSGYTVRTSIIKDFNCINLEIASTNDLHATNNIPVFGDWEIEMELI